MQVRLPRCPQAVESAIKHGHADSGREFARLRVIRLRRGEDEQGWRGIMSLRWMVLTKHLRLHADACLHYSLPLSQ
jgi:hypothetical protein